MRAITYYFSKGIAMDNQRADIDKLTGIIRDAVGALERGNAALGFWRYPLAAISVFLIAAYFTYTQSIYLLHQRGYGDYNEPLTRDECYAAVAYLKKLAPDNPYPFSCTYYGRLFPSQIPKNRPVYNLISPPAGIKAR